MVLFELWYKFFIRKGICIFYCFYKYYMLVNYVLVNVMLDKKNFSVYGIVYLVLYIIIREKI